MVARCFETFLAISFPCIINFCRKVHLSLPSCKTRRLVLLLNFEWCRGRTEKQEHVAVLKKKNEAFFIEKVFLFYRAYFESPLREQNIL